MIYVTRLKSIIYSILIILLTITLTITINKPPINKIPTESSPKIGYKVVIDAGHGGIDGGAIGKVSKKSEAELNLLITKKLESLLLSAGIEVVLTRKNENGLYGIYTKDYKIKDMKARREIILNAKADIMVSIHMNSFSSSASRGAQVFYDESNDRSSSLALSIQNIFKNELPESNKGISIGDYYILKCDPSTPSVLCECGFLSNPEDEQLLISDNYQEKVAYSIYKGIILFLNIGINEQ